MKPAQFEYFAPATLEAALDLLTEHADNDAKVLAGGQSSTSMASPVWNQSLKTGIGSPLVR
jgi:CO/xanthine dehydrogenase FAD-binding subunit